MKLWMLGLLPAALLTTGGLYIAYLAYETPRSVPGLIKKVRHTVTPAMESASRAKALKPSPLFNVNDAAGQTVSIGGNRDKPQFLYFVQKDCPCSYDAEPIYQRLAKRFGSQVDFTAITDGDSESAKRWQSQMNVQYPVVPDPNEKIISAYGARSSVYAALLGTDGRIVKLWPGYSRKVLAEMNSLIAKELGVREIYFNPQYAPIEKATGCAFKWVASQ